MPWLRFTSYQKVEQGDGQGEEFQKGERYLFSEESAWYWRNRGCVTEAQAPEPEVVLEKAPKVQVKVPAPAPVSDPAPIPPAAPEVQKA